jgi:glutaredoxin
MKRVTVYALSTCPWCRKIKDLLTEHGVPFDFIDYDLADEATQKRIMEELDREGTSLFPFVRIDGIPVTGYQPDRVLELLGL